MADKKAQLIIEGNAPIDLPVYSGTLGPDVVDVRGLTAEGFFTFDPGFMATSSCESKITFIDGENGVLLHRGYPIEQLAEHSSFMEVAHLLLRGELPISWKPAFCCSRANCPLTQKKTYLSAPSRITPWCTSNSRLSLMAFAATPTPWPSCVA